MAIGNASMVLHILADDRVLERVLKQSKNDINNFSRDVEKAGKKNQAALSGGFFGRGSKPNQALRGGLSGFGTQSSFLFGSGAFIGSAAAVGATKAAIDAASDLNEQITKSQQVFGKSAETIRKWSEDTAKNIGIGQTAALQAAGAFGNLFKAQGFGDARNSQLSKNLVQLAADLASFNNVNPAQVLEDLNSAIVGEIEPVRKYGVNLRVARVQQEALAQTGKSTAKELTQQELTLARLSILYKDTTAAQGDFARTSGGLANQQRILTAQVQDLAANLGTLLLPAASQVVSVLNDVAEVALTVTDGLKKIAAVKIPAIHIPFVFDFPGGGTIGGALSKAFKFGKFLTPIGPTLLTAEIIKQFKGKPKATDTSQAQLVGAFEDSIGGIFKNPLNEAVKNFGKSLGTTGGKNPFADLPKITGKSMGKLIEGLNLGLDRAELTQTASDNIAILRQLVEAYQIEVEHGIDVKNAAKNLLTTKKQLQDAVKGAASEKFSNIIDSLGLGVEKAQITKSLDDDVAALQAVRAGLLKQIAAGVDVRSAQHQLVSVNAQIAQTQEQIKQNSIDKVLGALQSGVDKARLTKGLADDLKALRAQAAGLRTQIKAGNDVASNQSQLVSVLENIKSLNEEIAQQQKDAQQSKLFKQIGLSATGGEIIPGVANLKKQFEQLSSQDLSGVSKKLTNRLAGVAKALKDPILKAQPEVRSAIKDLFQGIRDELNNGKNSLGPRTLHVQLSDRIIQALGFDPNNLVGDLRRGAAGGALPRPSSAVALPAGGGGFVVNVNGDIVTSDPEDFLRQMQKKAARTSGVSRGRFPGRSLGLA